MAVTRSSFAQPTHWLNVHDQATLTLKVSLAVLALPPILGLFSQGIESEFKSCYQYHFNKAFSQSYDDYDMPIDGQSTRQRRKSRR